jgi:hypothetical protein
MRLKKLLAPVSCFLSIIAFGNGDQPDFAVSKIPAAMLKNAHAVVRLDETRIEIPSIKEMIRHCHQVVTILDENGDDMADFVEYYDKFVELSDVEGRLYDANGKQLKKMKFRDLQDMSGVDDNSLIDDNRVKHHNFYYKAYPYTVEYDYEVHYKYSLFFPSWDPRQDEKVSVEKSTMSITCPEDYQFRYKMFLYNGQPAVTTEKGKRITTWTVADLPAIVLESFSPAWHELSPYIIFGPTDFQFGDYKGNMATWQDFGKFVYALKQGRDALPPNVKSAVHQIADGLADDHQKIRALYEYMQKNTRYISIQLGIGGWQPFDAEYVASKGYGDCKALTNYMYSLLKEAGIHSFYTVIRSGSNQTYITDDFPSQQFDHVILCVPQPKDTVWLECTNQSMPAGYLGGFTCDRYGLLIDEAGGVLVKTPHYGLNENTELRHVVAEVNENASLIIKSATIYKGLQQDDVQGMINALSKDKVKEYLQTKFDFATYDLENFNYKENKSALPDIEETLDIYVSNYASATGKRLFIAPNIMARSRSKLRTDEERKYDIVMQNEWRNIDTVEITMPSGYEIESMPEPVFIAGKFGKYQSRMKVEGNKIIYYRLNEKYRGRFPASDYKELVNYYDAIYRADRNRIVFVKKE